ncbi:MAG: DUF4159 domain-containing protein [Candidatus Solibacter sp.]
MISVRVGVAVSVLLACVGVAVAQRFGGGIRHAEGQASPEFPSSAEFQFVRVEYTDLPQFSRGFGFASRGASGRGWWMVDWPDCEEHFSMGVRRLTRVETGEPKHLSLTDPKLFDYPWIYATQVGYWGLTRVEAERLGEYLKRGGYLVVDDFWGPEQWEIFRLTMDRALPNHPIVEIAHADSVMHVLYDIEAKDLTWIPGTRHLRRNAGGGVTLQQPDGTAPAWRAIFDDKNRMVVAVNFNTDVGDAWEYADSPDYPEAMTTLAYHYGLNYLVYAMSH